jgi:dienelactone hydrolase
MRVRYVVAFGLVSAFALGVIATDQPPLVVAGQTVVVPSGNLRLKAFLWKPNGPGPFPAVLFCHGSGGADAGHTAGLPMKEAAEKLAPLFLKHGYAFLYLFRRGQGLSADQGAFMQDVLEREQIAKGEQARQHLQFIPPVGQTSEDGHNFLYLAIPRWEHDVFRFLDEHVKQ